MFLKTILFACNIITCYNICMKKLYILILFIVISSIIFAGGTKEIRTIGFKGAVDYLEGDVFINGNSAVVGSSVEDGDVISTEKDSSCEIIFNQGNIFHLEEETLIEIKWAENRININKGAMGSVFSKLKKLIPQGEVLTLSTPSAAAGVRGTAFYIRVEDEKNTYICTCNGSLKLSAGDEIIQTETQYHKAYRFTQVGEDIRVSSAGLLYHKDEDMDKLASRIDQAIPWVKSSY